MDPFAALELPPGASPPEIAAAYRRLAKQWHPDHGGGAAAAARMAEINVAYDVLRAGAWQRGEKAVEPDDSVTRVARSPGLAGAWLAEPLRRALGRELLVALDEGEAVTLVTPAATWASPRTLLAVTDRRLLWLLDDAISHRVRSLAFKAITAVEVKRRRRSTSVRVSRRRGRPIEFAELPEATASAIARALSPAA